ncbi:MAG TPA: hypothetical protein VGM05_11605 [Planctomycetaceae bacterium]|jgi:hypothetical protein
MTILLPVLAVVFAAFCVWLTVRIVNRRERWAKWTLAGAVGVPVLYVASFGPIVWLADREIIAKPRAATILGPIIGEIGPDNVLWSYGQLGCREPFTMLQLLILASVKPDNEWIVDSTGR